MQRTRFNNDFFIVKLQSFYQRFLFFFFVRKLCLTRKKKSQRCPAFVLVARRMFTLLKKRWPLANRSTRCALLAVNRRSYYTSWLKSVTDCLFSCLTANCKKMLDSTNATEHDDELFCRSCYGKKFGPKGYGYGGGAGVLSMDDGTGYIV